MASVSSGVLIGRDVELGGLTEALAAAAGGRPSAVVLTGEAGIGKSRLLRELQDLAPARGAVTITGGCIPLSAGALPYAPLTAALRQGIAALPQEAFAALPTRTRAELGRLLPELRGPDHSGRPEHDQTMLFDAVLSLLRVLADAAPLVLVLEDVQWSDASTRDLVTYLLNMVVDERIVFLCSLRTGELDPDHPALLWLQGLATSRMTEVLELQPLTREDTRRQIAAIAGTEVHDRIAGQIFERSEGNPFFVEELLQALASGTHDVPPSLRQLLLGRIAAVSPAAISVVNAVAVDGPIVPHDLLLAVTEMTESQITPLLRSAIDHHLLVPAGADGYAFRHALLRDAVYGRLLPGERRALHRAFAQALDTGGAAQSGTHDHAARRARHWYEAGHAGRALPYAVEAAAEAERSSACAEALQHYEQALGMWDQVQHPEQICGLGKVDLLERAAAAAAQRTGHAERAVALYRQALALVDDGSTPQRAAAIRIAMGKVLGGPLMSAEAAHQLFEEARALVTDLPPTAEKVQVLTLVAGSLSLTGRTDDGLAAAAHAMDVAQHVEDELSRATAHAALALAHSCRDDPQQALGHLVTALGLARQHRDTALLGHVSVNLSAALFQAGRAEEAVTGAVAAIEELAVLGNDSFEGFLRSNAAEFLIALGRWDEAQSLVGPLEDSPALLDRVFSRLLLAEIDVERGRFGRAAARAQAVDTELALRSGDAGSTTARQPTPTTPLLINVAIAAWERRLDDASDVLDEAWPSQERHLMARALTLGARVEADRAVRSRVAGAAEAEREALARAAVIEARCEAAAAGSLVPGVGAVQHLVAAEGTRLRGRCEPDLWSEVVGRFEALGYRYQASYARYRYGESLLEQRDRQAAAQALSEAAWVARDLRASPLDLAIQGLAQRARLKLVAEPAAVTGAEAPAAIAPPHHQGLTRREVEVLRHVSAGLTNKQVAQVLFISPKTASIHVSSILSKLGVSSRTEAARWAFEAGLLEGSASAGAQ